MSLRRPLLAAALTLAGLAALPAAATAPCEDPRPLRLALIPKKNPEAQLVQYQPLIRRLEAVLERRVEPVRASSYAAVIEGLVAGGIDLAELGPAAYALAQARGAGIEPFASFRQQRGPTTDAAETYRSLLIGRRDGGPQSLAELRGRSLSLTDPASTSGAVLPRRSIEALTGVRLEDYFSRVTFAGSHDRAIEVVRDGLVDAAFVSSSRVDEALRRGRLRLDEVRVLWRSAPIPYDPFVHRSRLCPALKSRLREVFLGDTGSLAGMFAELDVTGFAPVADADYRDIHALFAEPR